MQIQSGEEYIKLVSTQHTNIHQWTIVSPGSASVNLLTGIFYRIAQSQELHAQVNKDKIDKTLIQSHTFERICRRASHNTQQSAEADSIFQTLAYNYHVIEIHIQLHC